MNTTTTNTAAASCAAKHYAERDHEAQGTYYINHVSAMTGEGLHAKSDIAAELAHRDIEIDRLRAALAAPAQAVPAAPGQARDAARVFWQQHTQADALSMTMAELHDDVEIVIRAARGAAQAAPVDADRERLNWLEQHEDGYYNLDRISSIVGTGFFTGPLTRQKKKHTTLRAAIDAARAAQKGGA